MQEQERKFILKSLPSGLQSQEIKQAYLILDGKKQLRVRIIDDKVAILGFKIVHGPIVRTEYEYEIPLSEGMEMFENAEIKLTKTRFKTIYDDNQVDIDIYPSGKAVVEIEFESELTSLPDYCGDEVTGVKEYSNIWIAKNK